MAENNSMQEFLNSLGALTTGVNATIYELNDAVQKIKKTVKRYPFSS